MSRTSLTLFDSALIGPAVVDAFKKLDPRTQWRSPVMFVVYVGSIITTLLAIQAGISGGQGEAPFGFIVAVAVWLWFTVLFANFAEALAEGRSKAQAASLRALKQTVMAKKMQTPKYGTSWLPTPATDLRKGMTVLVEAGDVIPADGEVTAGVASVDESAITGESAPVIRESGGDFSAVTGGTRVLSDWLLVRVSVNPGEAFIDRMIAMVEGAKRQKTPNEIALTILLVALSIVFLIVTVTLLPYSLFSVAAAGSLARPVTITVLIALLVCLIPTTIGGLLSAIGVAGMSRMMQANVIATSGRAVEAAGDVDVLLLDKTGTITLGNRQASSFVPAPGVTEQQLADAAQLASLADETPEGRSIVVLAKQKFNIREREMASLHATFVPFTAQTRMSGVDIPGEQQVRQLRKGAADSMKKYVEALGQPYPAEVGRAVDDIARRGSTPLVVVDDGTRHGRRGTEGYRQGRHQGALRGIAPHGHQDRHDHGRQQADGRRDCGRSGRGRFPRRSDAGRQAETDPQLPVRRPPGGDDGRRHQRCPGAGAGRRGRGHEFGHAGGQGGGQYGRPRFEPDQAAGNR